jgi:hypothetical protein
MMGTMGTTLHYCQDCNEARSRVAMFKGRSLSDCRRLVYEWVKTGVVSLKVFCLLCDELERMSREGQ